MNAGLYSVLLKWGLESVAGVIRDKDPNHLQILLEAIKTRNAIVLKRFDFAWEGAQEFVELNDEVEVELSDFVAEFSKEKLDQKKKFDTFAHKLCMEFHPPYYRRLRKIRNKFEATNDLFSAYSIVFLQMLAPNNIKEFLQHPPHKSMSDAVRTFRQFWSTYGAMIHSLIRVTSCDLRFWLIDASYFQIAEKRANSDREFIESHFKSGSQEGWTLPIENHKIVKSFWDTVEQSLREP